MPNSSVGESKDHKTYKIMNARIKQRSKSLIFYVKGIIQYNLHPPNKVKNSTFRVLNVE
jgi:hypothetical protein